MAMKQDEAMALAQEIAASMGIKTGKKQRLLVAVPDEGLPERTGLTALQRDVIYGRISDLAVQYNLGWLVRQDTTEVLGVLECLPDEQLRKLLERLEVAVECVHEGVPFVERGLVKGVTCLWVA